MSFQLFSLRENVVFKKLGVYGRKRPKKSSASRNTQKPANPISHPVGKADPPPQVNDEVLPVKLPDLPKPADEDGNVKPVTSTEPPAAPSTNSR